MKRSHKIISWVIGTLVTVMLVLAIVIATFDWNRLKPYLNDRVSQAIGRPFSIQGDLTVDWQRGAAGNGWRTWVPLPEFTARNILIGNPSWAAQPQFAQLDALHFRLSLLALLSHQVDVPAVRLEHPVVDLERNEQGQATWDFSLPQSAGPSTWSLAIGSIGFDRGHVTLDDAKSALKLQTDITPLQTAIAYDQIVAQQSAAAGTEADVPASGGSTATNPPTSTSGISYQFAWQAQGSYQHAPVKGSGKIGAVLALQQSGQPFPLQADVHIGDTRIGLVGTLTDPMHLAALDLKLWFAGSSMAKLYPILGVTLPDTRPYATAGRLQAQLHRSGSRFSYQNFRGRVGGSDIAGTLVYTTGDAQPKLVGELHSRLLQFADLAPLIGGDSNAQKKQRGDGTPQPSDKILPIEPFRTERWKTMDADVEFRAGRIVGVNRLPIEALDTHLILSAGALQLAPLHFGLAGGNIGGTVKLDGSDTPMKGSLDLSARHLKLKQLFPSFASMQTSLGDISSDVKLNARGNSVASLLGSSNGETKLLMSNGAISKTLLETAGLNVGNIVMGKLFGDKTVQIHCAAADMLAKDGLFTMQFFVVDTEDALIKVDGTVNMATEKLDLHVIPQTKGIRIFSLRSPLYASGTLKNPDVGVQKGPLIIRGVAAVALGVLVPPAALLALISPTHNDDGAATCSGMLQQLGPLSKTLPPAAKSPQGTHPASAH